MSETSPAASYLAEARANAGDHDALRHILHRVVVACQDDLKNIVDIGILLRDAGLYTEADHAFDHILQRDTSSLFGLYERAISRMLRGFHVEALLDIERMLAISPLDARAALLAARLLQSLGDHQRANQYLCIVARDNLDLARIYMEFGEYILQFPRGTAVHLCAHLEAQSRYLATSDVIRSVSQAVSERRGFSFVRMGDGEGAYMQTPPEEERRFSHLYESNRRDRANIWFAGEINLMESGFEAQALQLAASVGRADVVGLPYRTWLEHEFNILSVTSICSLLNVLRVVPQSTPSYQSFCRQDAHIHFHQTGDIQRLLGAQTEIGLISCHSSLPERLSTVFNLDAVEFHKLPGEKFFRHHLGENTVAGSHYPDVFNRVMQALDRPLNGKLFLVAGGILGKFYCGRIKESGGVALDVGSLVDVWMGAETRPGITQAGKL